MHTTSWQAGEQIWLKMADMKETAAMQERRAPQLTGIRVGCDAHNTK